LLLKILLDLIQNGLRTYVLLDNQKIKGKLDNRGYSCMFIGYTEDHAYNVYVLFNLKNQAIFMSLNVLWLHKLFHQHMKTESALILGFTAYDVTPTTTKTPPAIVPTIAPAPIAPRLTRTNAPRIFTPPSVTASDDSYENNNADVPVPPPNPHATFDMHDTNAPLAPCLPRELHILETFYNPQPGDKSNIALLTHSNDDDEMLAYPYKAPDADLEIISNNVELCNVHLPEYDSNPQSAAQDLLSKKSKHWWKAMITGFLNCEEKKA
jgi:hypothetical protein